MSRRLSPAFVLIALVVCVVVAGPLLSPYAPNAQLDIITLRSQAPSLAHPFGTDAVSRDVLSRVLDGGRVSLALAILSVSLSLVVGTLYGAISTLAGGVIDTTMRRALDIACRFHACSSCWLSARCGGPCRFRPWCCSSASPDGSPPRGWSPMNCAP